MITNIMTNMLYYIVFEVYIHNSYIKSHTIFINFTNIYRINVKTAMQIIYANIIVANTASSSA